MDALFLHSEVAQKREMSHFSTMKGKMRADELLVHLGLCENRTRAQALIMAGQVKHGTERVDKASRTFYHDTQLSVLSPMPYVGRGGLKMQHFLTSCKIPVTGLHILDLGASTGGFTDCLLQKGASFATCVDVGHGQLHYKLRTDSRVTNLEKTNLRKLQPGDLPLPFYPLVVMDLSFISLKKVLPNAWQFVARNGYLIALVKPQFECLKQEADRTKGVIKDETIHQRVLAEIKSSMEGIDRNASLIQKVESQPRGNDGNKEYFYCWKKEDSDPGVTQSANLA